MHRESENLEPSLENIVRSSHLKRLAANLGEYLGVGCDAVTFTLFLSRGAARLGLPIHMAIATDCADAVRRFANRIAAITDSGVAYAQSVAALQDLLREESTRPDLILLNSMNRPLLGNAMEMSSRGQRVPALWWIGSNASPTTGMSGPILRITAGTEQLCLAGYGHHYCGQRVPANNPDRTDPEVVLQFILDELPLHLDFQVPFQEYVRAALRPDEMLITNRLMRVIAATRLDFSGQEPPRCLVTLDDYAMAREILAILPVTPAQRTLPPEAIQTAMLIHANVIDEKYQRSAPGHSELGNRVFTREQVRVWTGLSYNGVKRHLNVLEDEGVIRSTIDTGGRQRGREIVFAFNEGRLPPFHCVNSFMLLPRPEEIARNCNFVAQT